MKNQIRSFVAAALIVSMVSPAFAQAMPDRRQDAQVVADAHPELWTGTDNKRQLAGMICTVLNRTDSGLWGLMRKDDRTPPYIPEDIVMWRPTRAHVDVLHDSGVVPWIVHTETPTTWTWVSCGDTSTDPPPPSPPPQPPLLDVVWFQQKLMELHNELLIVKAEARDTKSLLAQGQAMITALTTEAVTQIKEHRQGVQKVWLKVSAIAGPILTAIFTWLKLRGGDVV